MKLEVELIPRPLWGLNLRKKLEETGKMNLWSDLRKRLMIEEGYKCWICGREDSYFEAHEFWIYNDKTSIQKLDSVHLICDLCHKVKHFGRTQTVCSKDYIKNILLVHFFEVNKCKIDDFRKHFGDVQMLWLKRNEGCWKQDYGKYKNMIQRG